MGQGDQMHQNCDSMNRSNSGRLPYCGRGDGKGTVSEFSSCLCSCGIPGGSRSKKVSTVVSMSTKRTSHWQC